LLSLTCHTGQAQEDTIKILVGFHTREEEQSFSLAQSSTLARTRGTASSSPKISYEYQQTDAIAMEVTQAQYEEMQLDDRFAYVEKDPLTYKFAPHTNSTQRRKRRYLQEVEEISYALISVQGDEDNIPLPPSSAPSCLVNVCIVDAGMIEDHYDIPYTRGGPYIDGQEFGLPSGQFWWNAKLNDDHGTAVAGIMIAKGGNDRGTVGVIPYGPEESKVCLSIARVFADDTDSTATSNILRAVEWCGNQAGSDGKMVVNLSLGADAQTSTEQSVYRSLYNQGVLFVAAGGNNGNEDYAYPASLDQVISVASVDEEEEHSKFSQENDRIELAAPGGQILTSSGGGIFGKRLDLSIEGRTIQSFFMENNEYPSDYNFDQQFELVDCGFGFDVCEDAAGKVCLMQRDGVVTFREKVTNCQSGGGIMALVFNNLQGSFNGFIGDPNTVDIPSLSLNIDDGEFLMDNLDKSFTTNNVYGNVGYFTGTSFSTPYVAGVAAKVWAARPDCTNDQIRTALRNTARPVENAVPNDRTGYGIVQAVDAYNYILGNFAAPCGGGFAVDLDPTPDPTPDPSPDPTPDPSPDPTPDPSPDPSPDPTADPTPTGLQTACAGDLEDCETANDCCSGQECRRISADPTVPWACRRVVSSQDKGDFKLARVGYCRGGVGSGCPTDSGVNRRKLRGEQAVAPSELPDDTSTTTIDDGRDQSQEDEEERLPEA
jgi:serine protease